MEANDMKAMREALEIAKKAICNHARKNHTCDSLAWENSTINANCGDILCGHRDLCEAKTAIQKALSNPPRACDVMSQEDLTKVVISGFMKSLGIGQENQLVRQLTEAAISAAIKCAYDTQLVSKGEEGAEDSTCNIKI